MNKLGITLMAGTLGILLMPALANGSSNFTFVKVTPPPVKEEPAKETVPIDHLVSQALDIHLTQSRIPQLKKAMKDRRERLEELQTAQKQFDAMNECNIKRLQEQFKNPEEVWNKMTAVYDQREKDLTIYVNSSEVPTAKMLEKKTDINNYSDREISEMLLHWSLGNEILTDVYANQDKWGTRKAPKSPSFPLWEDQKFLYDQKYNDKYTKLNAYFGVPPQMRPAVTDEVKYDYNRADEMVAAHNAYLAKLTASDPKRALTVPAELKNPPEVPPRPLPPVEESVLYIGDVEQSHQIFPAWPEPWQKQIENNFVNYNTKGELARDFRARSFKLKDDVLARDASEQNNRLNVYQQQKKKVDGAKKMLEVATLEVSEFANVLQEGLDRDGIPASVEALNLQEEETFENLQNRLKSEKLALIDKIEKNIKGHPREYSIQTTINALKKDANGKTYITPVNAANVDQLLAEAAAADALIEEQEKFAAEEKKKQDKRIDKKCLNGGV